MLDAESKGPNVAFCYTSGSKVIENSEIYESYMYFAQIACFGKKSQRLISSTSELIHRISQMFPERDCLNLGLLRSDLHFNGIALQML